MILKTFYTYPVWKIQNFPIGLRERHRDSIGNSLLELQTALKLSQTFPNPYQIYNVVNQLYTAILNPSFSPTAIFSIL